MTGLLLRRVAPAVACGLLVPVVATAQARRDAESPSRAPAERARIHCVVLQLPIVAAGVRDGRPPLLVVSGRVEGRVARPEGGCPARVVAPEAGEIRYIRPFRATEMYGEDGRDGVVQIDWADGAGRPGSRSPADGNREAASRPLTPVHREPRP